MRKVLLFLFISVSFAQGNYYEQELEYTNLNTWGLFGQTISSSENHIGIYGDNSIHIFHLTNGIEWEEIDIIMDEQYSVSQKSFYLRNNNLLIGDWASPINYIFVFSQGEWILSDSISYPDSSIESSGGIVSISDNYIIITMNDHDGNRLISYYNLELGDWDITKTIEVINDYSYKTCLYENEILLGKSIYDTTNEINRGIVFDYRFINDQWNNPVAIEPSLELNALNFGSSILKTENYLFIGAPIQGDESYAGFVYVYQNVNDEWVEQQILTIEEESKTIGFGYDIDGNDSTIVIGAPYEEDAGLASGAAYIFKNINGTWQRIKKIIPSNLEYGDMFGTAVSMTDDFVFIGAPMKNGLEGAVYVYDSHDTTLHANFAGDVRTGNAPVTVQFTAVPQGNPTAYEWDFNSDGFIDSTEPNPQFTYYINGVYTVTLTVYDETGSDEEVKTDYIQVVSDILFGDVNGDGFLNVSDLVLYIDFILGYSEPEEDQFLAGDVNYSGQIDIIDIVMVIDEILN